MKTEYKNKYRISYTQVDQNTKLSLVEAFYLIQNMMTEYFESFKSDNIRIKKYNKAIWVLSKTKVHFNKYPIWKDVIKGRSYTTKVKPVRIETETSFKDDKKDETLFLARQETCLIDLETRKIRKLETVNYPDNMETEKSEIQEQYLRLNEEFTSKDFKYEQKIYSTDIDYSRHTNNVAYVKYISNTLSCDFFDKYEISDFEIHFINESKEGETLQIYKKEKDNNLMEFVIKEKEKEIVRVKLKYRELN